MVPVVDSIDQISPSRDSWKLKVRVIRMWRVPAFNDIKQIVSVEMILMDETGCKIQAGIKRVLMYKFVPLLEEGNVYRMGNFSVDTNVGACKAVRHPYKLSFLYKTYVVPSETSVIPRFGLSLKPYNMLYFNPEDDDYLVDVIGVVTSIIPSRQMTKNGCWCSVMVVSLRSESGNIDCVLYGEIGIQLQEYVKAAVERPVVIVQLAEVKIFSGFVSLHSAMFCTRVLINPDIEEVHSFRLRIGDFKRFDPCTALSLKVGDSESFDVEDHFTKKYPRTIVQDLVRRAQDGICVVSATIDRIDEDFGWWYTGCVCLKSVVIESGVYYCPGCDRYMFNICPRYKLMVMVADRSGYARFMLSDCDLQNLLKISCLKLLEENPKLIGNGEIPSLISKLVGQTFLFKVDRVSKCTSKNKVFYRVNGVYVCDDIIDMFEGPGAEYSPLKICSQGSSQLSNLPKEQIMIEGKVVEVYEGRVVSLNHMCSPSKSLCISSNDVVTRASLVKRVNDAGSYSCKGNVDAVLGSSVKNVAEDFEKRKKNKIKL